MTVSRSLALLGLLIALPISAAQAADPGATVVPAPFTQQELLMPSQATIGGSPAAPIDPLLGAVPMTCVGDFSTATQSTCAPTCQQAQDALIQPLTDAANSSCAPSSSCNRLFAFKWLAVTCPPGNCGVSGSVVHYGCPGGGGGGGDGGCNPPC